MSIASKVTLATTIFSSIALISFVHLNQKAEQAVMHEGVIRDMNQQKLRAERQADFDMQKALEAEYRKEQEVKNSSGWW